MTAAYATDATTTGSGTSAVCSKPASTASGDLLIAALNTGSGCTGMTAPAGWTAVVAEWTDSNDTAAITWYKVAGGSEPASYTFTWTTSSDYCCSVKRFTAAASSSPIRTGARHDQASGTGANFTSTALSGTQPTDLTVVIAQMGDDNGVTTYTVTSPASPFTTIDNFKPTGSPKFQGASYAAGSQAGAKFTSTSSFAYWNITSFAILPASATAVTLADTGTGADALSPAPAVPLADAGTVADAAVPAAAVPFPSDAGSGSDALSATSAVPLPEAGAGADSFQHPGGAVPLADSGNGAETLAVAVPVTLADTGTGADSPLTAAALELDDSGTGDDSTLSVAIPITLTDPDGAFGDDSQFTAGPLLADAGAGTDALGTGIAVSDAGSADDSAFTVAVAAPLAETGVADDQPWEYAAIGTAAFPYYAQLPGEALGSVRVGDDFLWYAAG